MSALIRGLLKPKLTDTPQSFKKLEREIDFSVAPILLALNELIDLGECGRIKLRCEETGQMCWHYFKQERVVLVDNLPPETNLTHIAMTRVWDKDLFERL